MPALLLFSLITIHPGCSKNDKPEEKINEQPGHIPGLGNENGDPTGELFKLPKGVSLVGQIKGAEYYRSTPGGCAFDGNGGEVVVKITLQRDSIGGPLTVEFPPGLIIVSASEGFQSGLLVESVLVTLPPRSPGSGAPQCTATLLLSCLNLFKKPSEDFAFYKFGPVTNSPLIKDLFKRLARKKIMYSEYTNKEDWKEAAETVQDAIWGLTDDDGLSDNMLRYISELPNK